MQQTLANEVTVWIGMGNAPHGEREGIYRSSLDLKSGKLSNPVLAIEIGAPEFLAIGRSGDRMYACVEADGKPGVAAFEVSRDRRSLKLINSQLNEGGGCHIAVDRTGRCLFTANYGTSAVAVFPVAADGQVQPRSQLVKHTGTGPHQERQEAAHPHAVVVGPENRFLFVPDLGIDKVEIYEMDLANGKLKAHGHGECPPGSGPRHIVFHPNERFAYVVNELASTVTVFAYDSKAGTLKPVETVPLLPNIKIEPWWTAAEIYFHPTGKFLFATTRGHDSVTAYRVNPDSGRLTFVNWEGVRGAHPRSFNVDPTGKWLLAAGRDSNTIAVFKIDPESGALSYNDQVVNSPNPICIDFQLSP